MSGANHGSRDVDLVGRMEDGVDAASDEERAARAPYQRIAASLGALPPIQPPAGWESRALAATRRPRGGRYRAPLVGAVLAAAAAIAIVWWTRRPEPPQLAMRILRGDTGQAMRGAAAIGDRLVVTAAPGPRHRELRVYKDARDLALRCPGDAACRSTAEGWQGELTLLAGSYQPVLLDAPTELPASRGLDADVHAVRSLGGDVVLGEIIDVR